MKENFIHGVSKEGFHKVIYSEYGSKNHDNTMICVHGLTRNGSDFHFVAKGLEDHYRVICPDVVGRGRSDRFKNPEFYKYAQYIMDMNVLINSLHVSNLDWMGTSMGGLFGIIMASMPNTPIRRLILNDIGPFIPKTAVDRIKTYAGMKLSFKTRKEGETILKQLYAPFGIKEPEHWQHIIDHSIIEDNDGTFTLDYDPGATSAVQDDEQDEDALSHQDQDGNIIFWQYWEKIKCPVLVINGASSDILPPHIIEEMKTRGPQFDYIQIPDAGHAPALMDPEQVALIREWLDNSDDEIQKTA